MVVVYDPTWGNPTKKNPHLIPQGAFPLSCTYIYTIIYNHHLNAKSKVHTLQSRFRWSQIHFGSFFSSRFAPVCSDWVVSLKHITLGVLAGEPPKNWTESRNWSHKTSQFGPCLIWFSLPFGEDDSPQKKPSPNKQKSLHYHKFGGPLRAASPCTLPKISTVRLNNYQTTPDNNLVRVDCPLNMTEVELGLPITPVEGTLCFFGQLAKTYAGNFDVNGSFWCGGGGGISDGWDGWDGWGRGKG